MHDRSHRATRALGLLAVGFALAGSAAAAPAQPGAAPAAPAAPAAAPTVDRTLVHPNSVVVFPFEKAPESRNAPANLGEMIAGRIRAGLDASGRYTATTYYPASPLVQRARTSGAITADDARDVIDPQRGVINQEAALRIAAGMGTASAVLGSVEDYTYDASGNKVDITATVQFLQVPSGTPIKTVGVTASATGPAGASQESVSQMAAAEVAQRALTEMGVPPPALMPAMEAPRNGRNGQRETRPTGRRSGWIPVLVLLGILATTVE